MSFQTPTFDSLLEGIQSILKEDILEGDNSVLGNHMAVDMQAVHMQAGQDRKEHIQQVVGHPGQCETSAAYQVLASPCQLVQTFHHACPIQLCVVSACMHKPCSKHHLTNNLTNLRQLEVHHCQQYMQL